MNEELNEILTLVLEQIKEKFKSLKNPSFEIWFGGFQLSSLSEEKAVFTTPSNLRQKVLVNKYKNMILESLTEAIGFEVEIDIISTQDNTGFEDSSKYSIPERTEEDRLASYKREQEIKSIISNKEGDKTVTKDYTFDNFIEGNSNKFARAACLAVAMEPTSTTYNPLFIYGESGLGKTHLLYATLHHIRKNHPNLNIVYKTSEDFINELISAIQIGDTASFKEKYRAADVLLIDDIQFLAGKVATQEEFFHTFSYLYESGKEIILTSDRPPKEIKPLSDRLRTRFEGGLIADVQKPSFELRTAIIKKKAADLNIFISNELVDYMAERLQHDIRQIEGALKKLKAFVFLKNSDINKEIIDEVISIIDPGNIPTDALIEKILNHTAKYYGTTPEEIISKKKTDNVASARHIAIYIIRKLTGLSLKKIGEAIGGRDHTTILASIEKVEINIKTKKNMDAEINKIIKEVKG